MGPKEQWLVNGYDPLWAVIWPKTRQAMNGPDLIWASIGPKTWQTVNGPAHECLKKHGGPLAGLAFLPKMGHCWAVPRVDIS